MKIREIAKSDYAFFEDQSVTPGFSGAVLRIVSDPNLVAFFTDEFRDWLFEFQDGRCGYCGDSLGNGWSGNRGAHVEHVNNRRLGGSDFPPNLMYSCSTCNALKGKDHYDLLRLKIPLKKSGLSSIITYKVASDLMGRGIDLKIQPIDRLYFELMRWPHVRPDDCRSFSKIMASDDSGEIESADEVEEAE